MTKTSDCRKFRGRIEEINGGIALVRLLADGAAECGSCALASSCGGGKSAAGGTSVRARIPRHAVYREGQEVTLAADPDSTGRAATFLLLIPLFVFLAVVLVCNFADMPDYASAGLGLLAILLSWLAVHCISKHKTIWYILSQS